MALLWVLLTHIDGMVLYRHLVDTLQTAPDYETQHSSNSTGGKDGAAGLLTNLKSVTYTRFTTSMASQKHV